MLLETVLPAEEQSADGEQTEVEDNQNVEKGWRLPHNHRVDNFTRFHFYPLVRQHPYSPLRILLFCLFSLLLEVAHHRCFPFRKSIFSHRLERSHHYCYCL